mgnify:CR=1 FL=1
MNKNLCATICLNNHMIIISQAEDNYDWRRNTHTVAHKIRKATSFSLPLVYICLSLSLSLQWMFLNMHVAKFGIIKIDGEKDAAAVDAYHS